MAVAPQDIVLPETLLAEMLAELQVWRALAAAPADDWGEIKVTLAAGTVAAGDAAARINQVFWPAAFSPATDMPFAVIRQMEPEAVNRRGSLILQGILSLEVFLRVPTGLEDDPGAAVLDGRTKMFALKTELAGLAGEAGRLDLTNITQNPGGINNPEVDGGGEDDRYLIADFDVAYEGGAC